MKEILKGIFLSAILVVVGPLAAFGSMISFDFASPDDGSGKTTTMAGVTVLDFNAGNIDQYIASVATSPIASISYNNAVLKLGSQVGVSAAPGTDDTTQYLSIAPGGTSTYGKFEISLENNDNNYFGMYWGSTDRSNRISFFNGGTLVESILGSDISSANGNWSNGATNFYFNITGLSLYNRVVLENLDGHAFEVDNIALGVVPAPEPATILLFGTGIIGLAGLARRKRQA